MIPKLYEVLDGVRHVIPYTHEFRTYCKGRWVGKDLFTVVTSEFGGHPQEYWENAIKDGNIKINNKIIEKSYIFRDNDYLTHITHRHEPPVVGHIEYIGDTSDLLAVSKPASLACHACGAYKLNSLLQILIHEPVIPDQPRLHLIHRLDRVTSGLVILAKVMIIIIIIISNYYYYYYYYY
jgi:tRNA pseudouridine synthase 9